jgi:alpha-tubulin suppressor-like RCC1 family protein
VLRSDGTVACWGHNDNGQVGDGTFADRAAPVAVAGLAGMTHVAMGAGHACAVGAGGTVACWGDGRFGELGDGRPRYVAVPTPIVPP